MKVKVLLFAGMRETMGREEVVLEVAEGLVARDLPEKIYAMAGPSFNPPRVLRFAVNLEYVASDTLLHEGDEVAIIPPVAGG